MNFAQYQRKCAFVEKAHQHHFIPEKCKWSLLKVLATQLRREGEDSIEAIRAECKETP